VVISLWQTAAAITIKFVMRWLRQGGEVMRGRADEWNLLQTTSQHRHDLSGVCALRRQLRSDVSLSVLSKKKLKPHKSLDCMRIKLNFGFCNRNLTCDLNFFVNCWREKDFSKPFLYLKLRMNRLFWLFIITARRLGGVEKSEIRNQAAVVISVRPTPKGPNPQASAKNYISF
jgi:hypothetical protein